MLRYEEVLQHGNLSCCHLNVPALIHAALIRRQRPRLGALADKGQLGKVGTPGALHLPCSSLPSQRRCPLAIPPNFSFSFAPLKGVACLSLPQQNHRDFSNDLATADVCTHSRQPSGPLCVAAHAMQHARHADCAGHAGTAQASHRRSQLAAHRSPGRMLCRALGTQCTCPPPAASRTERSWLTHAKLLVRACKRRKALTRRARRTLPCSSGVLPTSDTFRCVHLLDTAYTCTEVHMNLEIGRSAWRLCGTYAAPEAWGACHAWLYLKLRGTKLPAQMGSV